ncbi:3'-5' exonuclease [Roseateles sp.]|uniref:3'-5' exonuclease n=1 Tax=Roseateles sp. TaxID=1971397 RepID=UPI00391D9AC1
MSWLKALQRFVSPVAGEAPSRWVVLDVETTGLDAARDELLAIAALGLAHDPAQPERPPRVVLADSFELLLHSEGRAQPDAEFKRNVLIHGIGLEARRQGVPRAAGLQAFVDWLGPSPQLPLLGFHIGFDEAVIQRALRAELGRRLPNPWIDLAPVVQALDPAGRPRSLDEAMEAHGIACLQRHQASADALATAELLQALWPALVQRRAAGIRALQDMAAQRRWLGG